MLLAESLSVWIHPQSSAASFVLQVLSILWVERKGDIIWGICSPFFFFENYLQLKIRRQKVCLDGNLKLFLSRDVDFFPTSSLLLKSGHLTK